MGWSLRASIEDAARAFDAMVAVVVHPGFAQDLLAKAAGPVPVAPIILGVGVLLVPIVLEGMGAGAQGDDRLAGVEVVNEVLHLGLGQLPETQGHETDIGGVEGVEAGDIIKNGWLDDAAGGVDGE